MLVLLTAGAAVLWVLSRALRRLGHAPRRHHGLLAPAGSAFRVIVLAVGIVMCVVVLRLFAGFDAPNVLKLDTIGKAARWAPIVSPPAVIGLAARSRLGALLVATLEAASPCALLPAMYDANTDLAFAALWWWIWLPLAAAVIVVIDRAWLLPAEPVLR